MLCGVMLSFVAPFVEVSNCDNYFCQFQFRSGFFLIVISVSERIPKNFSKNKNFNERNFTTFFVHYRSMESQVFKMLNR
jgi:hypothetical protein